MTCFRVLFVTNLMRMGLDFSPEVHSDKGGEFHFFIDDIHSCNSGVFEFGLRYMKESGENFIWHIVPDDHLPTQASLSSFACL